MKNKKTGEAQQFPRSFFVFYSRLLRVFAVGFALFAGFGFIGSMA